MLPLRIHGSNGMPGSGMPGSGQHSPRDKLLNCGLTPGKPPALPFNKFSITNAGDPEGHSIAKASNYVAAALGPTLAVSVGNYRVQSGSDFEY